MLCMAPTEYRAIAKRAGLRPLPGLRHAVAAGEPLNPEVVEAWREEAGVGGARRLRPDRDRRADRDADRGARCARARWASRCPASGSGSRTASCAPTRPRSRRSSSTARTGTWRTGDRVRQDEDGYLWFEGRTDDVIISAGYRIGPFEVESALVSHAAVAEAAAVAAPDEERGQVVRAVVVLRPGHEPGEAPRARAPGPRQGADGALQVPAHRGVRRRAAEDRERQDQAGELRDEGLTIPRLRDGKTRVTLERQARFSSRKLEAAHPREPAPTPHRSPLSARCSISSSARSTPNPPGRAARGPRRGDEPGLPGGGRRRHPRTARASAWCSTCRRSPS